MRSLLENAGYSVCGEAESGTQAIESAPRLNPDLILLDYSMPGLNGAETASILKSRLPEVPIILFTLTWRQCGGILQEGCPCGCSSREIRGNGNLTQLDKNALAKEISG